MSFHPFAAISEGDAANRPWFLLSAVKTRTASGSVFRAGIASFSAGARRSTRKAAATRPSAAAMFHPLRSRRRLGALSEPMTPPIEVIATEWGEFRLRRESGCHDRQVLPEGAICAARPHDQADGIAADGAYVGASGRGEVTGQFKPAGLLSATIVRLTKARNWRPTPTELHRLP